MERNSSAISSFAIRVAIHAPGVAGVTLSTIASRGRTLAP